MCRSTRRAECSDPYRVVEHLIGGEWVAQGVGTAVGSRNIRVARQLEHGASLARKRRTGAVNCLSESVSVADRERPRDKVDVARARRPVLVAEGHKDGVPVAVSQRLGLWIGHADDVQIVVRTAETDPAAERGSSKRESKKHNDGQ